MQRAMKEVTSYWNERLAVKKPVKKILLDRQCAGPGIWSGQGCPAEYGCQKITKCGEVEVPEEHLSQCQLCGKDGCKKTGLNGSGVQGADMIIYMSAKISSLCKESATLSHASHCQQVQLLNVEQLSLQLIKFLSFRKLLLTDRLLVM